MIYTKKSVDLTGKKFGYLTAIERAGKSKDGRYLWKCVCDCGNTKLFTTSRLTSGKTTSCGCHSLDNKTIKHGMKHTRIYETWCGIKKRCNNKNSNSYGRYGALGIRVCPEWENDFQAFYDWAIENGYTDELTIDRIDNHKGYSPDNCRWVSWDDQAKNKRNNILIEYDGEIKILAEWCREFNFPYDAAKQRYRHMKKQGKEISLEALFYAGSYNKKAVNQFSLDGVFIKRWETMTEAEKSGYDHAGVSACCNGKNKTAFGYRWEFAD